MDISARRKVVVFLVLTFALCAPFYYLILSAGSLAEGPWVMGLMWCPGIAALLTRLAFQRNLRGVGWGWGRTRYQVASYLLPALAGLVVYGAVWVVGLGGFSPERLTGVLARGLGLESLGLGGAVALAASLGFAQSVLSATGEEIGWRGLLVPELARGMGYARLSLVSGAVWAIYHYPLLVFADYHSAAPRWWSFACFTWTLIVASFVFAWFRLRSGSVWTAVVLHASHNLFIQDIFDRLTVSGKATEWVTTEFGAGLAIVYSLVALWCWRHRGELPQAQAQAPGARDEAGTGAERPSAGLGS